MHLGRFMYPIIATFLEVHYGTPVSPNLSLANHHHIMHLSCHWQSSVLINIHKTVMGNYILLIDVSITCKEDKPVKREESKEIKRKELLILNKWRSPVIITFRHFEQLEVNLGLPPKGRKQRFLSACSLTKSTFNPDDEKKIL